jgi:hypothetical protein
MTDFILLEIAARPAERSRGRRNPRVVQRKMSNFPTKARAAPAASARSRLRYVRHIQIIAPAVPAELPPAAMPKVSAKPAPRRRPKAAPDRRIFWLEQVKAWRSSNLSRTA